MLPGVDVTRTVAMARAFAESNMSAAVSIVRKRAPEFDPATGRLEANSPIPVYSGKARVYPATGPLRFGFADEPAYFSQMIVSIPVVTDDLPMIDDLVMVTSCPGDPAVVGRVFQVRDVEAGSQWLPARRLQVIGVQESQQWSWPAAIDGEPGSAAAAGGSGAMVGNVP